MAKKRAGKAKKPVQRHRVSVHKVKKVKKVKKASRKRARTVKTSAEMVDPSLEKIGEVTHYFPHVNAAAVKLLKSGLRIGDKIYIKGHTTDFKEDVASIQLDHAVIEEGRKGQEIGLLVKERVRIGDKVYRVKR